MIYHERSEKLFRGAYTTYYRTLCGAAVQDVACAAVCPACREGPRVTCQECIHAKNSTRFGEFFDYIAHENEAARVLGTLPMVIEQPPPAAPLYLGERLKIEHDPGDEKWWAREIADLNAMSSVQLVTYVTEPWKGVAQYCDNFECTRAGWFVYVLAADLIRARLALLQAKQALRTGERKEAAMDLIDRALRE